jgi:hypothetical protein
MHSKLKVFSIGLVAENKEISSKIIKVSPIEIMPLMDGELREEVTGLESKGLDADGSEYTVKVDLDITLDAEWFSLDSNRRTPEDVRRGEQVLIWQYGDTDKYYWTSMGRNDELRRLETVIWAWSDESDPDKDISLTADNTYNVEVSTHKKHMTIQTCKNDGEDFAYTVQINSADSTVTIKDDGGNFIQLDSANTKIQLRNADTTDVALDKKDINMYAPRDMNILVDNNFNISVGNNMTVDVINSISMTCTDYSLTASASINNTTASYTTTCPINTFTGNLVVGGTLAVAGGGGGGGGTAASVVGNMEITGDGMFTGNMTIAGNMTVGIITCAGIQSATPPVAPGGAWHYP